MDTFFLYKSTRKNKKYTLVMPSHNHRHSFGDSRYRDYTLINSKNSKWYIDDKREREKIKNAYRARHRNDKGLNSVHAPSEMSMVILWSDPTLDGGIRAFERKHNVRIKKMF